MIEINNKDDVIAYLKVVTEFLLSPRVNNQATLNNYEYMYDVIEWVENNTSSDVDTEGE